ncbi:MAG: LacI family transcriptional regulator [Anaerolineae bacterium]|nr:LacI family transcriptional regulator [Anaerolineae bacterium]
MPVTIRDLANKLNLSITQVSRALGGYNDVSETTRQKVLDAAHEMGYEPSYAARQLRRKKTDAIGFILPTSSPRFSDPFYASFLTGLCDEAACHQIDVVVSSSPPDSEQEKDMYRRWSQGSRVDGLVINRIRVNDWRIQYLADKNIPFVTLGRPEHNFPFPSFKVNERYGFYKLTRHLINKGHQRIAFVGGPDDLIIQIERSAGYYQALEEAGLDVKGEYILKSEMSEAAGFEAVQALLMLPEKPDAILTINDQVAIGGLRAIRKAGFKAGTDIAIAGYDGIRETAFTDPPLTTIYQPTYEIARQLVLLLLDSISQAGHNERHLDMEPDLILRESTDF